MHFVRVMIRPAGSAAQASLALVTCIPYWDSRSRGGCQIFSQVLRKFWVRARAAKRCRNKLHVSSALWTVPLRCEEIRSCRRAPPLPDHIDESRGAIGKLPKAKLPGRNPNRHKSLSFDGHLWCSSQYCQRVVNRVAYLSVYTIAYDPRGLHWCRFDALCSYTVSWIMIHSCFADTLHQSVWLNVVVL